MLWSEEISASTGHGNSRTKSRPSGITTPVGRRKVSERLDEAGDEKSLVPLKNCVHTVLKHYDGVVAFIETGLTNAVGEGLNRIVTIVKNRASGFRTLHAFADLISLTVGDLDIAEQIPSKFRPL